MTKKEISDFIFTNEDEIKAICGTCKVQKELKASRVKINETISILQAGCINPNDNIKAALYRLLKEE